jgi:hypothetical protein
MSLIDPAKNWPFTASRGPEYWRFKRRLRIQRGLLPGGRWCWTSFMYDLALIKHAFMHLAVLTFANL